MRGHLRGIAAAVCAVALSGAWAIAGAAGNADVAPGHASVAAEHASVAAGRPAIWRAYDMLVDFQSLPRTYTCDQLWYEFHGLVLRLGAPAASISILPYDCSPSPSGDMKSPRVEVRFQLPYLLQPGVKGAPIEAVERTVRLSPGEPKTLHASDCQLLRQIDHTLLASLPVKVDAARFDCSAPPPRAGRFAVTVSLPVVAKARTIAAAGGSSAGSAPH